MNLDANQGFFVLCCNVHIYVIQLFIRLLMKGKRDYDVSAKLYSVPKKDD